VEVAGSPPGKFQMKLEALVLEVLLNCTTNGIHPIVSFALNAAVGGVAMVTV
jgi:hypothetical protein